MLSRNLGSSKLRTAATLIVVHLLMLATGDARLEEDRLNADMKVAAVAKFRRPVGLALSGP